MAYTQPPNLSEEEIQSLLKETKLARICSLNQDGTIHAATVNFKHEAERILIATPKASRKARNLQRDGTVTVLVDVVGEKASDIRGAVVYGKADVKELTLAQFIRINETWMSADRVEERTQRFLDLTDWVLISVDPVRMASWDYAKDEEFAAVFRD